MNKEYDYSLPAYQAMFGNFGLTALAATSLEKTVMLLLIAVSKSLELNSPPAELYKAMQEVNNLTLGRLIKELNEKVPLPEAIASDLEVALKRRNYLIHHFYFVHKETLRAPGGANRMSDELRPMRDLFAAVQTKVDSVLGAVLKKYSIDREVIDKEAQSTLEGEQPGR